MVEVREYAEKSPRVARAMQWDGRDFDGLESFCYGAVEIYRKTGAVVIHQSNGKPCLLLPRCYVVEHDRGSFLCMDEKEFKNSYEEVRYGC